MKAVSCLQGEFSIIDLPTPEPTAGQLLLDVHRCGICGSDVHARSHADDLVEVMSAVGYDGFMRRDTPVVFGHEFSGVVAERGAKAGKEFKTGTPVVSFPLLRSRGEVNMVGLSPHAAGGYAEQVLAEASLSFVVPNGLDLAVAALTEPMAVALHAVRRSDVTRRDVAVVIGCGPVGLAVICHLKAMGVGTIVASDFSPGRRALASRCGAHIVVDPAEGSPYQAASGKGVITAAPDLYELAVGSMEKLRKLPGWAHLYRLADRFGAADPKRPVVFECVGVPGMIEGIVAAVPLGTRVVVAGVCMEPDRFLPALAVSKEVDMRFVFGYTPLEFRDTLHMLADGKLDAAPMITATVGLDGVDAAFAALGDPERHAKILIDPRSSAATP